MQKCLISKCLAFGLIALFTVSAFTPLVFGYKVNNTNTIEQQSILGRGTTLYVGGSGEGNYSKIQEAIDNASDGDTIFVYNGTYFGWVWIEKSISLIGEDKNNTIIEGGWGNLVIIRAEGVLVTGFNIHNCGYFYSGGIHISSKSGNTTIIENIFTKNIVSGISIQGDYNIIKNNIFKDNCRGIKLLGANNNTITGNIIDSSNESGIYFAYIRRFSNSYIENCSNNIIKNNIITNNSVGIFLENVNNTLITKNLIAFNKQGGIYTSYFDEFSYKNNTWIKNNTIAFNYYGISIINSNNCHVYHNNFNSNTKQSNDEIYNCEECINQWDNSYPEGGNYWNDYTGADSYNGPNQDIPGSDGIGDLPYNISGNAESKDRYPLIFPWNNNPPNTPIINGPTNGKVGVYYNYTIVSTDPDGENLYYDIIWGDGAFESWLGPYESGETITIGHMWSEKGTYTISARVYSINGWSNWGELEVSMPRNRQLTIPWLLRFLDRFPNAFPLLRQILL